MSNPINMELLGPAGGMEQACAAINFGADAIYLAAHDFGMRAAASNFSIEEIDKTVKFAHRKNVKVYVTVNILMHQANLANLESFYKDIVKTDVDAFIIGDLGAIALAKKVAPNVAIHVSTQASVANSLAAIEYAKMGAKRIVLAREMSLTDITQLRSDLDLQGYQNLELEAFVHGAMCMSVSGRCLISSYLADRSANKGACTQPCRWSYSLVEENRAGQKFDILEDSHGSYILNSMDMNMLEHLFELQKAGVASIKIEGRNKKTLYVATVVNAYRHVLDGQDPDIWADELDNISHRPYSTGFYFGPAKQTPDYDGYEQNCVHVADVVETYDGDAGDRTYLMCRNRFEEGQELEAIVPGGDIVKFLPVNLGIHKNDDYKYSCIDVANIAKKIYSIERIDQLVPGSIIRLKTYLRTSRK